MKKYFNNIVLLSAFALLTVPFGGVSAAADSSLLTVTDGIYSGLTVRIQEEVPKHFCSRLLNQLEVRAS